MSVWVKFTMLALMLLLYMFYTDGISYHLRVWVAWRYRTVWWTCLALKKKWPGSMLWGESWLRHRPSRWPTSSTWWQWSWSFWQWSFHIFRGLFSRHSKIVCIYTYIICTYECFQSRECAMIVVTVGKVRSTSLCYGIRNRNRGYICSSVCVCKRERLWFYSKLLRC